MDGRCCTSSSQVKVDTSLLPHTEKTLASDFSSHQCFDLKALFLVMIYDGLVIFPEKADLKDSNNRWIM